MEIGKKKDKKQRVRKTQKVNKKKPKCTRLV
jgi:hypothetical protein